MPAIGSWSPSKASSPCFPVARRAPGLCRRCAGPPLGLEMLRAAKPRLGGVWGEKEEGDKSSLGAGGRRAGGCAGSALGFVFQILLGGFYALGTSCAGPLLGWGGVERGVSSSLKVLTN